MGTRLSDMSSWASQVKESQAAKAAAGGEAPPPSTEEAPAASSSTPAAEPDNGAPDAPVGGGMSAMGREATSEEMEKIKSWGLGYGLDDHEAEVEVEMADPNSPIYSTVDSFEALDLNPSILKGIQVGMKFSRPSKIQETALPLILTEPRTNLIAQSQSGTGKTAAFVVGMLSVVDIDNPLPQALCLAPTRELAVQTFGTVGKMGEYTGFKIHCMVSQDKDKKKNKKKGKSRRRHVDPVDAQVVV